MTDASSFPRRAPAAPGKGEDDAPHGPLPGAAGSGSLLHDAPHGPLPGASGSGSLLHAWAVLTVLVMLPLLFLGAEVTTKKVGMVDAAWPTSPWHLFGIDWRDSSIGYLIEHGHRLAAYAVGAGVIVLVVGLWRFEPRRWVRWLGVAALLGVVVQGLLGGVRVLLNVQAGPELALVHGCFAQLVFALLVSLALCTSRSWRDSPEAPLTADTGLRRGSLALAGLLVGQLVLGALIRHEDWRAAQRLHVLAAFVVVGLATWLVVRLGEQPAAGRNCRRTGLLVIVLLTLQLLFGVEAWMLRGLPETGHAHWLFNRTLVRSGHVVTGALLLATAVALALEVHRRRTGVPALAGQLKQGPASAPTPSSGANRLEGAA